MAFAKHLDQCASDYVLVIPYIYSAHTEAYLTEQNGAVVLNIARAVLDVRTLGQACRLQQVEPGNRFPTMRRETRYVSDVHHHVHHDNIMYIMIYIMYIVMYVIMYIVLYILYIVMYSVMYIIMYIMYICTPQWSALGSAKQRLAAQATCLCNDSVAKPIWHWW